jgi:hypothetical protein
MKLKWFRRTGMIFIPSSFPGWIISLIGSGYAVYSFLAIDSRSHSASDTLRPFIFRLMIIFAVYYLIAYLTAGRTTKG